MFNSLMIDPPSFISRPKNVEAEEGSTVTLNCDVDGQPTPEIRWLFHEPGRIGVSDYYVAIKNKEILNTLPYLWCYELCLLSQTR